MNHECCLGCCDPDARVEADLLALFILYPDIYIVFLRISMRQTSNKETPLKSSSEWESCWCRRKKDGVRFEDKNLWKEKKLSRLDSENLWQFHWLNPTCELGALLVGASPPKKPSKRPGIVPVEAEVGNICEDDESDCCSCHLDLIEYCMVISF